VGFGGSVGSWGIEPSNWGSGTESSSCWGAGIDSALAAFEDAADVLVAWAGEGECCYLTALSC
jgi:hypothetical protein